MWYVFIIPHEYHDKMLISKFSFTALIFRRSVIGICTDFTVSNSESRKNCNWLFCSLVLELLKSLQELGILSELLGDHQNVNQMDIRYDGAYNWPIFCEMKLNCPLCKTGDSRVYCTMCNNCLCLSNTRNCFYDFHINK